MLKTVVMMVAALMVAAGANGQESSGTPRELPSTFSRWSSHAVQAPPAVPAGQTIQTPAEDEDESGGWNSVKRGFYAGLIAGGVVGAFLVMECGHPECGPLLTLAAGAGAGIGVAIDALVDRRRDAPGLTASHNRRNEAPFSRGRHLAVGIRTSW
jgi:hypothetical protein